MDRDDSRQATDLGGREMTNPYAPPKHSDDEDQQPIAVGSRVARFFRVSPAALVVLYIVTLGLYGLYWFYKHWAIQKQARGLNISAIARGVVPIFFVHRLFKIIDQTARATGVSLEWRASSQATMYVMLVVVARVVSQLGSTNTSLIASLALFAFSVRPLWLAQRAANLANGRTLNAEAWVD